MNRILISAAVLYAAAFFPGVADAQMNNKPYSFGSGPIGISKAGRQAIIDQKLDGATPDNLFRDEFGNLQSATRGPNGVVILTDRAGVRDIGQAGRQSPLQQGPGRFNSFFVKFDGLPYRPAEGSSSGATIDGWTGNVHGAISAGGNSVDVWTSMVYFLSY